MNIKKNLLAIGCCLASFPGVEFVSVDPQYLRDLTDPPIQGTNDSDEDFYWLNRGGEA